LAISKKLAEMMGGEVGFESQEGVGSTFWFTAKFESGIKSSKVFKNGIPETSEVFKTSEVSKNKKDPRILLVEDNIMNQKVALAILKNSGFSADIAENGKTAIEMLGKAPYDIVLMDIQMPEMDGVEATKKIRSSASDFQNIPIVAMTAHAMKGDREYYLESGMDDYISKPIQREKLIEIIRKVFSKRYKRGDSPYSQTNSGNKGEDESENRLEKSVFDKEDFLKRLGGNKNLGKDLLIKFKGYVSEQMEALKNSMNENNAKMASIQAHGIKGMFANISAWRARDAAYEIELAGKKDDLNLAVFLMTKLEKELEILLPNLKI